MAATLELTSRSLNLKQHLFVKICAVYTILGWLASELTLILNCHPVSGYWTLPPPQRECATYFRFEVIQFVFNVSSDIAILLVILPMLFRTRMPWRTKLPVLVVFAMGIVVVCPCFRLIFADQFITSFPDYLRDRFEILHLPQHLRCELPVLVLARSIDRRMGNQRPLHLGHGSVHGRFPSIVEQPNIRTTYHSTVRNRPTIPGTVETRHRGRYPINPRPHRHIRHRDHR